MNMFLSVLVATIISASSVSAQEFQLEEWQTTGDHFGTVYVHNQFGSGDVIPFFDTQEGRVHVHYVTHGWTECPPPNTRQPEEFVWECADDVWIETPPGVIAVPMEFQIDEHDTVTVRLYRWLGV